MQIPIPPKNELKYESEKADISLKRLKGSSCRFRETKSSQLNFLIWNVSVKMLRTILQLKSSCGISGEFPHQNADLINLLNTVPELPAFPLHFHALFRPFVGLNHIINPAINPSMSSSITQLHDITIIKHN